MSSSLIPEVTNNSSYNEHIPDSHWNTSSMPTSVNNTTSNILDDVIPWNDENQHFTNTPNSKVVTSYLESSTPSNSRYCDNTSLIPLTLDSTMENHLSTIILINYEELLPTKESYHQRIALVEKIERLLDNEWPNQNIKANLFGSSVNHLGTNQSDVDICITTQWSGLQNVGTLARLFIEYGMHQVVCVPNAQVPIVRLFDPETQLACDININSTMALHNTKMIRTYIAIDPRVRPLAMMIKYWVKQRKLNDAADGGTLSTYTWTCMIINFLQMRQPPILPVLHQMKNDNGTDETFCINIEKLRGFGQSNNESLGGLLYAFFRRYSIEFDYDDQVVSVRHGRYLTKQEKGWHFGRNKTSLCVEEPFNVGRNLGNSADARSVRGIRMELNRALEMLVAGVHWDYICTPYRPLTVGTTAPVYGMSNIGYSAILPLIGNERNNSVIYDGYHGNDGSISHTTMKTMTPPPSLSSSSSSSSTPPPSTSPSSSSSSSPPRPPNHQYTKRSPSEQQRIIDTIAAKYVLRDLIPKQHNHRSRHTSQHHQHTLQRKNKSAKRQSNSNNCTYLTNQHPTASPDHRLIKATNTTSHDKHGNSVQQRQQSEQKQQQQQHQQDCQRRRNWSAKMTSEPTYCLDLLADSSKTTSPYTIEIKLPTRERTKTDSDNTSPHHIPTTSKLFRLDKLDDDGSTQQPQQQTCH